MEEKDYYKILGVSKDATEDTYKEELPKNRDAASSRQKSWQ